nr:leucine-rich repeat domain-containing protein [uncultured Mediterraneibacter sp.]
MKKRRRQSFFAVLLALVLALSGFTIPGGETVKAASDEADFTVEDGVLTGYTGDDEDVVIPSEVGGETVTKIETTAFVMLDNLKSVTIPATVTTIYQNAFMYCENLDSVTFEGKVDEIEPEAFSCCATVITFYCQSQYESYYEDMKDSITDQGAVVDASLPDSGKTDPDPTPDPEPEPSKTDAFGLTETADGTGYTVTSYDVSKGGANVVIPKEYNGKPIVAIGDKAFDRTEANEGFANWITSISIPDTVTSIGKNAFYGCTRLESITLPEGLESIGDEAFRYCNSLKKIEIPASVTSIGDLAFKQAGGAHLSEINVAADNKNYSSIDGVLFSKDGKTLICYPTGKVGAPYKMPDSTEIIANDAFKGDANTVDSATLDGQHKLTGIELSRNLKKVGARAFMQTSLESITIESDIEYEEYAFDGCKNVKELIIKEGVTEIPDALFYGFENCTTVKLPSTLKKIGYRAFDRLGATEIELPEGLEEIGEEAFENSEIKELKIPASVKKIDARAFYSMDKLTKVEFAEGAKLESVGAYAFNHCTALEKVVLPDSVKTLESGAFSYCYQLSDLTLSKNLTTLGDGVFSGSGIGSIELPDSIEEMGSCVFRDCYFGTDDERSLTSVKMPANLKTLGTCTFEGCAALTSVEFPEDIKLTTVPADTFFNCHALTYIYLPEAIATTEGCAFGSMKLVDESAANNQQIVIEYANKDLKRSIFDTYSFDPGESYYLGEDGFYYTTEEVSPEEDDKSNGVYDEIKKTEDDYQANGTTTAKRSAGSSLATCGCGTVGGSAKLSPSSNPIFKYKPASSGSNAGGNNGSNNGGNGSGNGGNSGISGSGNKGNGSGSGNKGTTVASNKNGNSKKVTGRVVKSGDESAFGMYLMLLCVAACGGSAVVVSKKRKNR